eukprot:TRINITY_DN35525_c0_g1_i2.p1 TRINITY_DN35525_c0_g1~~TRINITY_DN35525_c0_g1_i2.p1  ORF type:complete len:303 (+),score=87.35 TRINITY_DN35525_c0_g1_i2:135-1043(+)
MTSPQMETTGALLQCVVDDCDYDCADSPRSEGADDTPGCLSLANELAAYVLSDEYASDDDGTPPLVDDSPSAKADDPWGSALAQLRPRACSLGMSAQGFTSDSSQGEDSELPKTSPALPDKADTQPVPDGKPPTDERAKQQESRPAHAESAAAPKQKPKPAQAQLPQKREQAKHTQERRAAQGSKKAQQNLPFALPLHSNQGALPTAAPIVARMMPQPEAASAVALPQAMQNAPMQYVQVAQQTMVPVTFAGHHMMPMQYCYGSAAMPMQQVQVPIMTQQPVVSMANVCMSMYTTPTLAQYC